MTKSKRSTCRKSYRGVYNFGDVYNHGQFSDPAGRKTKGNYLVYGMASQVLFRTEAGSKRGLDGTFGFDWSPGDVSRENTQIAAGADPISSRALRFAQTIVEVYRSLPPVGQHQLEGRIRNALRAETGSTQLLSEAPNALIAALESIVGNQILPDGPGIAIPTQAHLVWPLLGVH